MTDKDYLKRAIEVGKLNPEPYTFGAVIVKSGKVIAETCSHVADHQDPSAHDGVLALRMAGQELGTHELSGCTMYCSDQPCLMCFSCAAWSGVDRVVYARPQTTFKYEFNKSVKLTDLAKQATNPIKIEQIDVA